MVIVLGQSERISQKRGDNFFRYMASVQDNQRKLYCLYSHLILYLYCYTVVEMVHWVSHLKEEMVSAET